MAPPPPESPADIHKTGSNTFEGIFSFISTIMTNPINAIALIITQASDVT